MGSNDDSYSYGEINDADLEQPIKFTIPYY